MFKLKLINKPKMIKLKCGFSFPNIVLANLQEKEIIPTKNIQNIVADFPFDGLSKVTVNPIPDEYIIPSGEIEINANGNYNVTDKASAKVNVPEKQLGTKTITQNGTYNASDDNLDGYSQVEVTVPTVDINDYFKDTVSYKGDFFSDWQNIIKKVPPIKVTTTDASYIFYDCKIDNFTQIDTSIVKYMSNIFYAASCKNIPELDASKVDYIQGAFANCTKLENFGGLLNLGQAYPSTTIQERYALNLSTSSNLTHDSLMNVLNKVYDISDKRTQIINLGNTNKAKLTAEEIAIATNKGWTVN